MNSPRYLALACAAVLLAGCDGAAPGGAATTSPDPEAAVGSYARGLVLGRRAQSAVLDSEAFIAGVRAGIADDDVRHGLDRTRCDDHTLGMERARRDGSADIAHVMDLMGQTGNPLRFQVVFHLEGQLRCPAHDQMDFVTAGRAQQFHQAHAIDGAGGAGNADNHAIHE